MGTPEPAEVNREAIVEMLIEEGHHQLDAQAAAQDSLDVKALGFLAFDAAAIAVMVVVQPVLHLHTALRWVPMAAYMISTGILIASVRLADFNPGFDIDKFFREFGDGERLDAAEAVLALLIESTKNNQSYPRTKAGLVTWGWRFLAGATIGAVLVGIVGRY